jgi:hypothetical protein
MSEPDDHRLTAEERASRERVQRFLAGEGGSGPIQSADTGTETGGPEDRGGSIPVNEDDGGRPRVLDNDPGVRSDGGQPSS